MKRRVLGKGLGALISDVPSDVVSEDDLDNVVDIPLAKIKPNPHQPRKNFDQEKLEELAASIKENGIIQPILVVKEHDYFQIVVGERRYRASILAGSATMPCLVKELSEERILELALVENIQREDLNALEMALSYNELMVSFSLTQENLAQKLGKSRSAIANTLRLLKLPEKIQEDIMAGRLSEGHARAILMVEDIDKMLALRDEVLQKKLSVRETEKLAGELSTAQKSKSKPVPAKDLELRSLENKLTDILGTKVLISDKGNKGKILIEYYSLEDFERIREILEQR